MSNTSPLVGPLLQRFLTEHLPRHKHASPQTILSYRDTFRLVLCFLRQQRGIAPTKLRVADLDVAVLLAFLDHLEQQRQNSVRSRNTRLAALRSFFRWVALCEPDCVGQATRVLTIPNKRAERVVIQALTRTEMEALLAVPDRRCWQGRRDYALLLTLYNSGARVSELVSLARAQVHFGATTFLHLTGKGRKERDGAALAEDGADVAHVVSRAGASRTDDVGLSQHSAHQIVARCGGVLLTASGGTGRSCLSVAAPEARLSPHDPAQYRDPLTAGRGESRGHRLVVGA